MEKIRRRRTADFRFVKEPTMSDMAKTLDKNRHIMYYH